MGYAKWTVLAVAVTQSHLILRRCHVLVVASLTEIMSSVAEVDCNTAAEQALPVDMFCTVYLASLLARSQSLQLTVFAKQVLFGCRVLDTLLNLAIDHATKVRLGTLVALVERASMHGK